MEKVSFTIFLWSARTSAEYILARPHRVPSTFHSSDDLPVGRQDGLAMPRTFPTPIAEFVNQMVDTFRGFMGMSCLMSYVTVWPASGPVRNAPAPYLLPV